MQKVLELSIINHEDVLIAEKGLQKNLKVLLQSPLTSCCICEFEKVPYMALKLKDDISYLQWILYNDKGKIFFRLTIEPGGLLFTIKKISYDSLLPSYYEALIIEAFLTHMVSDIKLRLCYTLVGEFIFATVEDRENIGRLLSANGFTLGFNEGTQLKVHKSL